MKAYKKNETNKKTPLTVYLIETDYAKLKNLQGKIKKDYSHDISLTEILRDSFLTFMDEVEKQSVEEYLTVKGIL